jgi:diguanylate cyclase (GGDEF)-like protein
VLDAALAELGLEPSVLDEVVPVALPALAPAVSGLAGRIAALERAATTDDVTGLLTRTAWMNAVREQLQAGRSGIVLVADLDGLAALDERHGYASGNLVLCELGRILGRRGTAGRLGGDALALWAGVDAAEADALAAGVRRDVHTRFSADGVTVDVTLGSAPGTPGDEVAAVLHAATAALEQARAAGRAPRAA